jgi:RND family efflux transporter MFP subunit
MQGRPTAFSAAAVAAFLLAVAGCQKQDETPAPPRTALVVEADPQNYPLVAAGSGTIDARNTTSVGFLVGGRMASRAVGVGDVLKIGDLIANLDTTDLQNQLDAAKAAVSAAQASVDQAAPKEAAMKKLLEQAVITQDAYNQALQALQSAQANLATAQANERLAESQLGYAALKAPVAGSVTQTGADPGQVVAAGQTIVDIAQTANLDAVFSVAARVAGAAKIGIPVEVSLQQDPSVKTVGVVRQISPSADATTGTYTIRVGLTDPPAAFRLGALVNGRAQGQDEVLTKLPATALLTSGDSPAVWVVGADGTVHTKPVKVARYDSDAIFIESGLDKGDLVVIAGVNSLVDGQKVTPEKVAAR